MIQYIYQQVLISAESVAAICAIGIIAKYLALAAINIYHS